jgi:hypothetical protein
MDDEFVIRVNLLAALAQWQSYVHLQESVRPIK